jgi:hypothetical protein
MNEKIIDEKLFLQHKPCSPNKAKRKTSSRKGAKAQRRRKQSNQACFPLISFLLCVLPLRLCAFAGTSFLEFRLLTDKVEMLTIGRAEGIAFAHRPD